MGEQTDIQLHFDVLSCRALLSCGGKDYVLPDTYPNREAAEAAAKKFAREKLVSLRRRGGKPSDLAVWLR
ncbi:hypothetical protein JQ506_03190 [Shinella sp. PSBB067]|uniref:hypothetical protein n=1 Tax=unclassified Shinella TaxID=2643062 RepID=UPI00193C59D0|nr:MULTISPECIES: hypothetical protein [unclassified Shinella]MBN9053447.1 hypothetical protein [Hyphomicrobiales bacterium]QRI64035.1 hypothetical protein JQ506_03190 [Shinella sp. PSBB067]